MVKWEVVTVALAMAVGLMQAVPAAAQAAPGPSARVAVDDATGDTQGPLPKEGAGFLDLTHAEAAASETGLEVRVTVASLQTDAVAPMDWELWIAFEYRGARFDAVILPTSTSVERPDEADRILFGDLRAFLWRAADGEQVAPLATAADVPALTFNATVPWDLVIEPGGNSPKSGEPVRIVEAASAWTPIVLGTPHNPFVVAGMGAEALVTGDRAPFPDGTFVTVPGAIGDLSLATPLATRFSNGEATTMHWPVEVTNHGGRELDVQLAFDTPGAEGRAPPGVHLAPGESKTVNLYATLPFAHDHGSQRSFLLTADSGAGDRATLALGIDYPAIPQPAGHHPDLWLHGSVQRFGGVLPLYGGPWMNTAETDERSNAELLGGGDAVCPDSPSQPLGGSLNWGTQWVFPLDPALQMGLDGRMGETASLDVTLVGVAALPPGTMHARLALGPGEGFDAFELFVDNETVIASIPVAATTGPASLPLHLDLPMPPELDLVPPSRGETIRLALLYCLDAPDGVGFFASAAANFASYAGAQPYSLATGGHLRLPLDEYHDAIPVSADGPGLRLAVADPVRRAAPGATLLWKPSLEFVDGAQGTFAVRLFGNAAEHARLLGDPRVGAEDRQLAVAFVVPDEAAGTVLDLLLDVTDETDPARSAALRLSVLVDPSATEDDSDELAALGPATKESPGLASLGAVLAAIAVAWSRRRRSP